MKLSEFQKWVLAWLAFLAQVVNALTIVFQNIPATGNVTELFSSGQQPKNVGIQFAVGLALYFAQSLLPRLQKKPL